MNLVLITSVVCTPNIPLSYINTRSCYTHDERFEQTKKTIKTIKEKIPNLKIFIVECSDLNKEQTDYFLNASDYFLNLHSNEKIKKYIYSISKSLCEGTMTHCALEYILSNNISFDKLIKISGRYWLSNKFDYTNFENSSIVIKYIDGIDNVFTALYQLPAVCVINYKLFLENKFSEMLNCIGYEVLFSIFIKSQTVYSITHVNPIGLEGYVSVSKEFYSG